MRSDSLIQKSNLLSDYCTLPVSKRVRLNGGVKMTRFNRAVFAGIFLEAEVAPSGQSEFERRYLSATGTSVTPGNPVEYQTQRNKWGTELRIYFNNQKLVDILRDMNIHVEGPRQGYKSGEFRFRANNNDLWWDFVESHGCKLGKN